MQLLAVLPAPCHHMLTCAAALLLVLLVSPVLFGVQDPPDVAGIAHQM